MRRILFAAFGLLLAACGGAPSSPDPSQSGGVAVGEVIGWDRSATTVILRLDRVIENEPPRERLNRLPLCTIYGDGTVLWLNFIPPSGEEVLATVVDEATLRALLEYIIRDLQYFEIPDYAAQDVPPSQNAPLESITLNISRGLRTIRSYRGWANDAYINIAERCRNLNPTRELVIPRGAWLTVYPVDRLPNLPEAGFPLGMGFKLADIATTGQAVWIEGPALRQLWLYQRQSQGNIQWIEDGKAYQVAIQAPGISRDAPPPPPESFTPTPRPVPTDENPEPEETSEG